MEYGKLGRIRKEIRGKNRPRGGFAAKVSLKRGKLEPQAHQSNADMQTYST